MNYYKILSQETKNISDPEQFWNTILNYAKQKDNSGSLNNIHTSIIEIEALRIQKKINTQLIKEPISPSIKSIFFGLYEQTHKNRIKQGFYISGTTKPKDKNGDFLCDPSWKPQWGYFRIKLLDDILEISWGRDLSNKSLKTAKFTKDLCSIKEICNRVNNRKIKLTDTEIAKFTNHLVNMHIDNWENNNRELYGYFLVFGAAIAIVKKIKSHCAFGKRKVFVGFDSGDFIEVK